MSKGPERSRSQLVTSSFSPGRTGIYIFFDILHQGSYKLLFKNEDELDSFIGRSSIGVHVHEYGKQQKLHKYLTTVNLIAPLRTLGADALDQIVLLGQPFSRSTAGLPTLDVQVLVLISCGLLTGLKACCIGAISRDFQSARLKLQHTQTG